MDTPRRAAFGAAALSVIVVAAGVRAAPTDAELSGQTSTLEGVIVTAQKRTESLERTPIAITAVTGAKISQAGLAGPQQLQFIVPSMTFGNNDGYNFITLRGIGTDLTTTAGEPAVATYVDGVYTGATIADAVPSYDLQRIEVLRGPQGTLYGRNAVGGVINYVTKPPSLEPGAEASASYGNYNSTFDDIAINGPLVSDVLAGRLSFQYGRHDGYRPDATLGRRLDSDESYSGRLEVLYAPTHALSVRLQGDFAHDRNTNPYELISQASLDGVTSQSTPLGIFSLPAADLVGVLSPADLTRLNGASIASYYGLSQPGLPAPDPNKSLDTDTAEPALFLTDSDGGSMTVDWDSGPTTVRSITAYRYSRLFLNNDTGGDSTPSVFFDPIIQDSKQFTQEINVSGKAFDSRLDWLAGAFYYHEHSDVASTVWGPLSGQSFLAASVLGGEAAAQGSTYPFALLPVGQRLPTNFFTSAADQADSTVLVSGPDFVGGGPLTAYQSIPTTAFVGFVTAQRSQSVAAFAQATYRLTERLRLTGGVRFTDDQKDVVQSLHSNLIAAIVQDVYGVGVPNGLCTNARASKTWKAPTGTVGLDYDLAPNVLTYGKASWGYKAGGFNASVCGNGVFEPEYLRDYEGGIKTVVADGQIVANAAIYYYDYTSIQFSAYINDSGVIKNAGSATALGVELEYALKPRLIPGLEIDGSSSYEDSRYGAGCFQDPALVLQPPVTANQTVCVNPAEQIKNNELIRAPRWKADLGAQYAVNLGGAGSIYLRGDAAWTDTIYNDIFNGRAPDERALTQPAYWMLNARLVWTSIDRRYEAEVFGNNLLNTLYATGRIGINTPASLDTVSGEFAPPLTFGVRLTVRFGEAAN